MRAESSRGEAELTGDTGEGSEHAESCTIEYSTSTGRTIVASSCGVCIGRMTSTSMIGCRAPTEHTNTA